MLELGECICWQGDKRDTGTVVDRNWSGVEIVWDDSAAPIFYRHNDMGRVAKVEF